MAELHLFGQIEGGSGFSERRLFCKWGLHAGAAWTLLAGVGAGQTQLDDPQVDDVAHWGHPLDVHLATRGLQGWPKLLLEVWHVDTWGRRGLAGYGVCHVPSAPGCHRVTCVTWRPRGTRRQRLLGTGGPELRVPEVAVSGAGDRFRLRTESAGTVTLTLAVVARNMARYGVAL
ncbi:B9 domain-containing protein 2-like [Ammospiza caudacuta]|uniref:B9 domain-containing protein 2-like n=1 Tax=Ammospiza caudacuta TaxID=2857398 RepID=UPI00273919E1|nr:B9 domain-containing protein 2-like [Ammospiza caudacuta]